jgi:hypothetical protein
MYREAKRLAEQKAQCSHVYRITPDSKWIWSGRIMLLLTEHDESFLSLNLWECQSMRCWQIDWLTLGGPSVYPIGPHRLMTGI